MWLHKTTTVPVIVRILGMIKKGIKENINKTASSSGLVGFYGISTIIGYLMPNPLYTYILDIYDLVWLGFMAYQPL